MICPECKNKMAEGISVCPTCGFDLSTNKWECEECHTFVDNCIDECPTCGAPKKIRVQANTQFETKQKSNKNSKLGLVLIIVACILCVVGFTRITNSTYKFYKQHYNECETEYANSRAAANYSSMFKNSYIEISNGYKSMMNLDLWKIYSFRIQAGACWVVCIVLLVAGVKKRKG